MQFPIFLLLIFLTVSFAAPVKVTQEAVGKLDSELKDVTVHGGQAAIPRFVAAFTKAVDLTKPVNSNRAGSNIPSLVEDKTFGIKNKKGAKGQKLIPLLSPQQESSVTDKLRAKLDEIRKKKADKAKQ
ncbi:hypothetical protein DL96DRAFT_1821143, partial [Flagelloscypha sp. PMI_526]